jgi:hypothetical protein
MAEYRRPPTLRAHGPCPLCGAPIGRLERYDIDHDVHLHHGVGGGVRGFTHGGNDTITITMYCQGGCRIEIQGALRRFDESRIDYGEVENPTADQPKDEALTGESLKGKAAEAKRALEEVLDEK